MGEAFQERAAKEKIMLEESFHVKSSRRMQKAESVKCQDLARRKAAKKKRMHVEVTSNIYTPNENSMKPI